MKLFYAVLIIYVVALVLFGAEGRGGGSGHGVEEPQLTGLFQRARRHVRDLSNESSLVANEKPPPPPPKHFRSRRAVANDEAPPPPEEFRQRRQAPPGLPPPPEGLPAPPQM